MVGQRILNYQIEKLIGEGGMGKVFLAQHIQLNRKVAIKVLHPHLTYSNEFRNRFKSEANLLAQLQHPNIVTLHDYVENNDLLALVMEFVEGTSLEDYLKNKSYIPESELIPLFSQVLEAFQYAHDNGIIHRDIKPANIILTHDGKVKILDFGIAKIKGNLTQTQTGTQMGTVLYMSPEQIKGQKVDIRSDIYSLGVTLFELATGKMPYNPNSSIYEVSNAIVHQPLPKPRAINPKISSFLEQIIQKATEKNPDARFQSCNEFLKALTPVPQKSLFSNLNLWIFFILILVGAAFFAYQIYERNLIQKNNQTITLTEKENHNPIIQEENSHVEPSQTQSEPQEPLPSIDFSDLVEGKKIKEFINQWIAAINLKQDFMDFFNYKVTVNGQELTKPEAFQRLIDYLKWNETIDIRYSLSEDYAVWSQSSEQNEYNIFETRGLKLKFKAIQNGESYQEGELPLQLVIEKNIQKIVGLNY